MLVAKELVSLLKCTKMTVLDGRAVGTLWELTLAQCLAESERQMGGQQMMQVHRFVDQSFGQTAYLDIQVRLSLLVVSGEVALSCLRLDPQIAPSAHGQAPLVQPQEILALHAQLDSMVLVMLLWEQRFFSCELASEERWKRICDAGKEKSPLLEVSTGKRETALHPYRTGYPHMSI